MGQWRTGLGPGWNDPEGRFRRREVSRTWISHFDAGQEL